MIPRADATSASSACPPRDAPRRSLRRRLRQPHAATHPLPVPRRSAASRGDRQIRSSRRRPNAATIRFERCVRASSPDRQGSRPTSKLAAAGLAKKRFRKESSANNLPSVLSTAAWLMAMPPQPARDLQPIRGCSGGARDGHPRDAAKESNRPSKGKMGRLPERPAVGTHVPYRGRAVWR